MKRMVNQFIYQGKPLVVLSSSEDSHHVDCPKIDLTDELFNIYLVYEKKLCQKHLNTSFENIDVWIAV